MRKLLPLFMLLLPAFAIAQKNAIKVNLSSLTLRNYQFSYERKIVSKLTVSLAYRTMPNGGLPMENTLRKLVPDLFDNPNVDVGAIQIGGSAFTIEPRLYLSKKAMKGFYIAPYARWSKFDLGAPIKYEYTDPSTVPPTKVSKTATFNGTMKGFSGGIVFGTQFNIAKRIVLDVCWFGGHFGSSNGNLVISGSFPTQIERDALKAAIHKAIDNAKPFTFELVNDEVTPTGAVMTSPKPWVGIRPLSVSLGIKF